MDDLMGSASAAVKALTIQQIEEWRREAHEWAETDTGVSDDPS